MARCHSPSDQSSTICVQIALNPQGVSILDLQLTGKSCLVTGASAGPGEPCRDHVIAGRRYNPPHRREPRTGATEMADIGKWLGRYGLGKYTAVFSANDVDLEQVLGFGPTIATAERLHQCAADDQGHCRSRRPREDRPHH